MTEQDKPTKISFVYSNPTDPDAFESAYPEQLAMARNLPGLTRLQTSKVWPKQDASPTPAPAWVTAPFARPGPAGGCRRAGNRPAKEPSAAGLPRSAAPPRW
jgi:hypothetical protein